MIKDGFFYFNKTDGDIIRGGDFCCWRADSLVFFADNGGQHSVYFEDGELEEFCQLLERASSTEDYVDVALGKDEFYLALEEVDEGTRNLCIIVYRLYMMYNLNVKDLQPLAKFLRDVND